MHLEWYRVLNAVVNTAPWETLPGVPGGEVVRSVLARVWPNVEILQPPKEIDSALTTNAAFVISAGIKRAPDVVHEELITPLLIATLLQGGMCSVAGDLWTVSVGGLGHLNASPSEGLVAKFMSAVAERGGQILLTTTHVLQQTSAGAAGELGERQYDIRVDNEVLVARAMKSTNEDVQLLLQRVSTNGPSEDERLMLLSLFADSEIEIRPYLQGIGGRENVPWYVRRFCTDWKALVSAVGAVNRQAVHWQAPWGENQRHRLLEAGLSSTLRELLFLRFFADAAEREETPELLLRQVLLLIRAFYSFYNLPECRALQFAADSLFNATTMAMIAQGCGEAVEKSLSILGFEVVSNRH